MHSQSCSCFIFSTGACTKACLRFVRHDELKNCLSGLELAPLPLRLLLLSLNLRGAPHVLDHEMQ
jgi:hypothetical protein